MQQMSTGKQQILSNLDSSVTAVAFIANVLYSVRSTVDSPRLSSPLGTRRRDLQMERVQRRGFNLQSRE